MPVFWRKIRFERCKTAWNGMERDGTGRNWLRQDITGSKQAETGAKQAETGLELAGACAC